MVSVVRTGMKEAVRKAKMVVRVVGKAKMVVRVVRKAKMVVRVVRKAKMVVQVVRKAQTAPSPEIELAAPIYSAAL
ncbi:MAG: uncharacterized protein KVP18_001674 [Porospora cf. gigantea A]|uniref:uncharacterized protein n=1 Tax=Porospora cf. gigantea A TaxID=2853593 RepID=UPI00355AC04A|nr:MAG: hypothetical protein KVP18_001674 [Porospora cf. gigantea A]